MGRLGLGREFEKPKHLFFNSMPGGTQIDSSCTYPPCAELYGDIKRYVRLRIEQHPLIELVARRG